jgi:hypothetical protein
MPGLTAKRELEILEEKAEKLIQRIFDSKSLIEKVILSKDFDRLTTEIARLFEIIHNNSCLD